MRRVLSGHFIPQERNNYIPRFFNERNMLGLSGIVVLLFFASIIQHTLITQPEMRAAVLAPVLIELANADREVTSLPTLTPNPILSEAARKKAEDMAARGYFSHNAPDGKTPWDFMDEVGYSFTHAGENLAVHFTDSDEVERAWMDSPPHRANILNSSFTEIGIGIATGEYNGRSTVFVVQMFGHPAKKITKEPEIIEVGGEALDTSLPVPEEVKGDSIALNEGAPIVASESYIAFVEETPAEIAVPKEQSITSTFTKAPSIFGRALTSPKTTLQIAYIIFASLIGLALLLFIFVEFKKQSPIHVGYSFMVLALIGGLWFFQESFIFGKLAIL